MTTFIAAADLHQHPAKWGLLVAAVVEQKPDLVLIAQRDRRESTDSCYAANVLTSTPSVDGLFAKRKPALGHQSITER